MMTTAVLPPEKTLLRLSQIIGDRKKGIPPIIPVSTSRWWKMWNEGTAPRGRKISRQIRVWTLAEIEDLADRILRDELYAEPDGREITSRRPAA